jgi:UDP-glucose:(heptosyl)LPS alpha-1,3-glucosyltransferase
MRIAFLIERLDPARGGAETWVAQFSARLAAEGNDVHVFARAGGRVPAGVELHPVTVSGIGRGMRTLSFGRNVDRMLAREKFDIVHGVGKTWSQNVYQPHGGVHLASLAANARRKSPAERPLHSLSLAISPRQNVFRLIERRQYVERPAAAFVALSQMVKRDMMHCYRVSDGKITVVYNGVDTGRFHPRNRERFRAETRGRLGIADDETVFLIVAHNFALKGVPELVRCVVEQLPACRLIVVGGGDAGKLRDFAESRAAGRVIFAGPQPDAAPWYASADACVHPTWYDPCSLVALEALASGLPVVTTTMNGAGELMREGVEGFVIEPGKPEALREAMLRLFDPDARRKMGESARALAEKHTMEHNIREMTDVYEKVLRTG